MCNFERESVLYYFSFMADGIVLISVEQLPSRETNGPLFFKKKTTNHSSYILNNIIRALKCKTLENSSNQLS